MKKLVSHLLNGRIEEARSTAAIFPQEFYGHKLLGDDGYLTEIGIDEAYEYPFPQKLGKELIKCMSGSGSKSLIENEFAAYNKVFKLFEPKSTQLSQLAQIKAIAAMSLNEQCKAINWPITTINARRIDSKVWATEFVTNCYPEEVVANTVLADGGMCSWCEGGSISLMLKASVLEVLARHNFLNGREDAVRRGFLAQLITLTGYKFDQTSFESRIIDQIEYAAMITELIEYSTKITDTEFQSNIAELCADPFFNEYCPRVKQDFLYLLTESFPTDLRIRLLQTIIHNPYKYGAGWPDLTVLKNEAISFIEVKTTDRLKESQIRFAIGVAAPLGLECQVVQVLPII
jgi:hypothetical protein